MPKTRYRLNPDEVKDLIPFMGYCYASDMITVEGHRVGYMHREAREEEGDSGWRFYSGLETQEYVDNPHNIMMFDVNYIANLDPTIIPYLKMRTGAELERTADSDTFERIQDY